jgi:hypothetical protein
LIGENRGYKAENLSNLFQAKKSKEDLTEITHKVYFDVEVDGKPAGMFFVWIILKEKKQLGISMKKLLDAYVTHLICLCMLSCSGSQTDYLTSVR